LHEAHFGMTVTPNQRFFSIMIFTKILHDFYLILTIHFLFMALSAAD